MTYAKPRFSAGIWVPNPTMSVPNSDGSGLAVGWEESSITGTLVATYTSEYADLPSVGHRRVQKISLTGNGVLKLRSARLNRHELRPGTPMYHGLVLAKTVNPQSLNGISLSIVQYNAAGDEVGTPAAAASILGTAFTDAWTLGSNTSLTNTIHADAVDFSAQIQLSQSSGTREWYIGFVGAGVWDGATAGHFESDRMPSNVGTSASPTDTTRNPWKVDEFGVHRYLRRKRAAFPYSISMAFAGMPNSDAALFRRLWNHNRGFDDDTATNNPNGLARPILCSSGNPALPPAFYANMGWRLSPTRMDVDPPLWGGSLTFSERVL